MLVTIKGDILFFILVKFRSVLSSSLSGDEALFPKIYPMHICQYPGFAVKGLIKIPKPTHPNWTRWLFSSPEKYLTFHRFCYKKIPHSKKFQFTCKSSPMTSGVSSTQNCALITNCKIYSRTCCWRLMEHRYKGKLYESGIPFLIGELEYHCIIFISIVCRAIEPIWYE